MRLLDSSEKLPVPAVIETIGRASILGGTVPVVDGLTLAHVYGFVQLEKEKAFISELSKDEILPLCGIDEINIPALRRVLFHVIKKHNFHWIAFYNNSSEVFQAAIPNTWIELLELADLFNMDDGGVLDWWKEVVDAKISFDQETNDKIGDAGEDLTCKYEVDRLIGDGIDQAEKRVVWVAQINDEYHYDVSSLRGELLRERFGADHPIHIEVKSSRIRSDEVFSFYLTRPEWNKAMEDLTEYYFYCWTGVTVEGNYSKGPFIINAQKFTDKVPKDSDVAKWEKCHFTLNLNEYCY